MEQERILGYIKGLDMALNGQPPTLEQWKEIIRLIDKADNDLVKFNKSLMDSMSKGMETAAKSPEMLSDFTSMFENFNRMFRP